MDKRATIIIFILASSASADVLLFSGGNYAYKNNQSAFIIYSNPFYVVNVQPTQASYIVNITPKNDLRLYEGGVYNSADGSLSLILMRDPFYAYPQTELTNPACAAMNLTITYPTDNQTFYFPTITPNVTFYLSGATGSIHCYHRIEGYAWNNWSDCGNGGGEVNNQLITLPEGQPVYLTVNVTAGSCTASQTMPLNVIYGSSRHQSILDSGAQLIAATCGLLLILGPILIGEGSRRRRRSAETKSSQRLI
jgi:hypothetical protein